MGQVAYQVEAQRLQDLAARQAILVYLSQKDFLTKNLDVTAFVRANLNDASKLVWMELRRHWTNFDLALQWQQTLGRATSEYGVLPDRRVVQLLGIYYF